MSFAFERDEGQSFAASLREIEGWHAANPAPEMNQLAERLIWRFARHWSDDTELFGSWLWNTWIEPENGLPAEDVARMAIPLAEEVFGSDRAEFGEWVERYFIERGVSREVCVEALGNEEKEAS